MYLFYLVIDLLTSDVCVCGIINASIKDEIQFRTSGNDRDKSVWTGVNARYMLASSHVFRCL